MPSLLAARRCAPWVVTVLATAASTFALDAVATAAGVTLAASGLLAGLEPPLLLVFLAASYLAWGAGLRVNLAANSALLARTAISTNVLSKAAHDLTKATTGSLRARRLAASVGYVGTELAKEVPYYVGAAGLALFSDAVSANDAIVFLGGTNLGAAAYEYGLARATRTFLRSRPPRGSVRIVRGGSGPQPSGRRTRKPAQGRASAAQTARNCASLSERTRSAVQANNDQLDRSPATSCAARLAPGNW